MRIATRVGALSSTLAVIVIGVAWSTSTTPAGAPTRAALASTHQEAVDADSPECPGPYIAIRVRGKRWTDVVLKQQVEIAKDIAKVPEFHDCQRFVTQDGKYGALYAVFASDSLNSLISDLAATGDPSAAIVVAEVYTRWGEYPSLGIKPGFNCLYLSRANGWEAFMVYAGPDDDAVCTRRLGDRRATATKLRVNRMQMAHVTEREYPAATRWDRDRRGAYYIGVKCGDGWCEVGLRDRALSSPSLGVTGGMNSGQRRVRLIKGWYDQQVLAIPAGANVQPQPIVGTVIPDPNLGSATFSEGMWTPVATIEIGNIPQYTSKLGLKDGRNAVLMRRIGENWHVRIKAPDGTGKDLMATRHPHEGQNFNIPGTVRWRWLAQDETIWVRCLEGCCQVQENGG